MTPLDQPARQRTPDQARAEHRHASGLVLFRRALGSGALASVMSTLAVSAFSRRVTGAAAAGTNAASQWFWYPRARHVDHPSPRYTLAGYAVHHASSVLWAFGFEALRPRDARPSGRAARATAIAALAYVVDYHVVPRRFSPGFEHRIRPSGMVATYGLFAVGLFLAAGGLRRPAPGTGHAGRNRPRAADAASPTPSPLAHPRVPAARLPDH